MILQKKWIEATEDELGVRFPYGFLGGMMRKNGGEVNLAGESWWLLAFSEVEDPRYRTLAAPWHQVFFRAQARPNFERTPTMIRISFERSAPLRLPGTKFWGTFGRFGATKGSLAPSFGSEHQVSGFFQVST